VGARRRPHVPESSRGRDDLYGSISEAGLISACAGRFHLLDRQPLTNGRILLHFEKIASNKMEEC